VSTRTDPGRRAVAGTMVSRRAPSLTPAGAVLLVVAAALLGGGLDLLTGTGLRLAFAIGLVAGAVAAALLVRRGGLLTVVLAPPLVYLAASALFVLAAPGGGTGALIDAATGWLVYGFPAIAAATGAAAVVAGVRLARGTRP
jgi:Domain of unknown function (DUF6542)